MVVRGLGAPNARLNTTDFANEDWLLSFVNPGPVGTVGRGTGDQRRIVQTNLLHGAPHELGKGRGCQHSTQLTVSDGKPAVGHWTAARAAPVSSL